MVRKETYDAKKHAKFPLGHDGKFNRSSTLPFISWFPPDNDARFRVKP